MALVCGLPETWLDQAGAGGWEPVYKTPLTPTAVFLTTIILAATTVVMFYKGPYLRLAAEREEERERTSFGVEGRGGRSGRSGSGKGKGGGSSKGCVPRSTPNATTAHSLTHPLPPSPPPPPPPPPVPNHARPRRLPGKRR